MSVEAAFRKTAAAQPRRLERVGLPQLRSLVREHAQTLIAAVGALAWVFVQPPTADLQAAHARAAAAMHGVSPTYWFSWFAGSAPGSYSVLTPPLTALIGVTATAACSAVAIALLARPLLAGLARPRTGACLVALVAVANLWSGRVPFSVGTALALAALLALRRRRVHRAGLLNAVAVLCSPLPASFALFAAAGILLSERGRWRDVAWFTGPTVLALGVPALLFGIPGAMPFSAVTLGWTIWILAFAVFVDLPRPALWALFAAIAASLLFFLVPTGVGANMSRFAFLVAPPLVWSVSRSPRTVVVIALLPGLAYSGLRVGRDMLDASQPAAHHTYYAALRAELTTLPGLHDHRVEVIDTATRRADAALASDVYLARGWETQADTSANPIFYSGTPPDAATYRTWLNDRAVAWVAVPSDPGDPYVAEAALVNKGLPYLSLMWHNGDWRLYKVANAVPIVSGAARVVTATESHMDVYVSQPGTVTLRVRPSRYLEMSMLHNPSVTACLVPDGDNAVTADVDTAGLYRLTAQFRVAKVIDDLNDDTTC